MGGGIWQGELWRVAGFGRTDFGGQWTENSNPTRQFFADAQDSLACNDPFYHPYSLGQDIGYTIIFSASVFYRGCAKVHYKILIAST